MRMGEQRVIDAGPVRLTVSLQTDDSEEARRYAELNRAATAAKERSYDEAVRLLQQAKALKGDLYDEARLAKFLQIAGRFDEALAEVQWLADKAGTQAEQLASDQAGATGKQHLRLNKLIAAHTAGALVCKREGRHDLEAQYEERAAKLRPLRDKLGALLEAEQRARSAALEQEREARRQRRALAGDERHAAGSGRTCLKCGHVNPAADGGYLEACPECGAIYTKVERAVRERQRAEAAKADAEEKARASAMVAASAPPAPEPAPAPAPVGAAAAAVDDAAKDATTGKATKGGGRWSTLWTAVAFVVLVNYVWPSGKSTPARSTPAPVQAVVSNSGWDGSVRQVKDYLRATLKDPDSLDVMEWSNVIGNDKGGFMVRVKYRAKNSFGGYVIEHKLFTLDAQGKVTGAVNL